jgi:hypothetical protein
MNIESFEFYKLPFEERRKVLIAVDPQWEKLENKLLSLGGDKVVFRPEPDLDKIVSRGVSFKGKSKLCKLENSRCHENSAFLWSELKNEGFRIVTGWALTKNDGMWRQHTWGLMGNETIETTVKRAKYFGVILTEEEATKFYANNS